MIFFTVNCIASCTIGCDKNNGECFPEFCNDCLNDVYNCDVNNQRCIGCNVTLYGDKCDKKCSNCPDNRHCFQNNGSCIYGNCENCLNGFSGCNINTGECSSCKAGFYDTKCDKQCSGFCSDESCGQSLGHCDFCKIGYFGDKCDSSCSSLCDPTIGCTKGNGECYPEHCLNCQGGTRNCDVATKQCNTPCVPGFFGVKCHQTCAVYISQPQCAECVLDNGQTVCGVCNTTYYADQGTCRQCSDGCKTTCNNRTGSCIITTPGITPCIPGRQGVKCEDFKCEVDNCDTCEVVDYNTCLTCLNDYYEDSGKCKPCNTNCTNGCLRTNGQCVDGCVVGWYGLRCDIACNANCHALRCDITTGKLLSIYTISGIFPALPTLVVLIAISLIRRHRLNIV